MCECASVHACVKVMSLISKWASVRRAEWQHSSILTNALPFIHNINPWKQTHTRGPQEGLAVCMCVCVIYKINTLHITVFTVKQCYTKSTVWRAIAGLLSFQVPLCGRWQMMWKRRCRFSVGFSSEGVSLSLDKHTTDTSQVLSDTKSLLTANE